MNKPRLSIILTSYKEPDTIARAIDCLLDANYSGIPKETELITIIPDKETNEAAAIACKKFKDIKWKQIIDPGKGKPHAINLGLKAAEGEFLLFTDGDVYFEKDAVAKLLQHFANKNTGAVTGRPIAINDKKKYMGYIDHLLADAAHHKRKVTMTPSPVGKSLKFVSREPHFFVLSGYIFACRNLPLEVPEECLIEDAYISYKIKEMELDLVYEPEAIVFVKYAQSLRDWYKQKLRSVGGYVQLWKFGVLNESKEVRNFWKELEYFWFPIKYATGIKELIWSLSLYPIRLWLWIKVFFEQKILKKDLASTWVRVESTK